MKKWFLHILLLAGLLGTLTTSCSQEEGLEPQTSDEKVQVVFTIALDSPSSARSRATWGDEYESAIGNEFDNYINPDQFFVELTLGSTTYDVQNIAYWQTNAQNVYEFVGEVDVNINATTSYQNAKIQVYANMNPGDDKFTTNYETNPGTGVAYIPMWGVQTVNLSLTPGTRTELTEPIYLLRAMAKVEVIMANTYFEIDDIKLNGYNNTGYKLPTDWSKATKTTNLDLEGVFRPKSTYQEKNPNFAESTTGNDYQCYTIYVPEYDNLSDDATQSTITVTVGGKEYDIEFKQYEYGTATSTAYNIVRNHLYRFNITGVKTELELTLTVQPWTDVIQTLNYQDELSYREGSWSNHYSQSTTDHTLVLKTNTSAEDDADVTAIYQFGIDTPEIIEWMAVLEDPEGKFEFDMSKTSGEGTVEGESARQRTVRGDLYATGNNLQLGIKAIAPYESGQYDAILRVYAIYGGKAVELDIVDGNDSPLNHFTIRHSKL